MSFKDMSKGRQAVVVFLAGFIVTLILVSLVIGFNYVTDWFVALISPSGINAFDNVWIHHSSIAFYSLPFWILGYWYNRGHTWYWKIYGFLALVSLLLILQSIFSYGQSFEQICLLRP